MDITSYTGPSFAKRSHHLYIHPAEELRDMIAHYTITFSSHEPVECADYHILPDASGCFIFQENDVLRHDFWGPMSEIVVLKNDLNEASERFFVEFLPGGLYQSCGLAQRPFVNMRAAISSIAEELETELKEIYMACSTYDTLVEKLNAFFLKQRKKYVLSQRCQLVLSCIDQRKGDITLEELAAKTHVSTRQLSRDFEKYIGLTIKEYANIVRFHHTLTLIERDDLTRSALQGGYFDQSHFNKVFKKITKTNPKRYLENLSDFYKEIYKF